MQHHLGAVVMVGALLFAGPSVAEGTAEKSCIFAAAQKLPSIPGLTIIASRVSVVPPEQKKNASPDMVSVLVEIDVRAAAQEATFLFACATGPGKPAFAGPVGISR